MYIDQIVSDSSYEIFSDLEIGEQRILKFIGTKGPMNLTELGKLTTKGTVNGFDRWGCKKRLEGTTLLIGLIPYDYIIKIKINKKETKYGLTLKGLLALLSLVKFEEIYLVDRYTKILSKYTADTDKVQTILNFIKHEIAYLLYFTYIQGINWRKFRFLKKYIEQSRTDVKANFHLYFEVDDTSLPERDKSSFLKLQREYGKLYRLALLYMGYVEPKLVYRSWIQKLKTNKFNPKIRETLGLWIYGRYWTGFIDFPKKEPKISELVVFYFDVTGFDMRPQFLRLSKEERDALFKR